MYICIYFFSLISSIQLLYPNLYFLGIYNSYFFIKGKSILLSDSHIQRLCIHRLCIHRLCIHRLCNHRLCIHRLCIHRLCIHRLCIHRLYIHRLCIHRLCIHKLIYTDGYTQTDKSNKKLRKN